MAAIPERLLANWRDWYPNRAERIAEDVRDRAAAAIEAWDLEDARPLHGGEVALVLGGRRHEAPVVCKLNPRDPTLAAEAAGLASWESICPQLLGTRDEGGTMLMERLDPGSTLSDSGAPQGAQLRVIGGLARRLHRATAPEVPRLGESGLARSWLRALGGPDRAHLERLLRGEEAVIHTDLHAGNVLRHGGEWRVIDPKPFRAMPEAEIWAVIDAAGLVPGREREQLAERLETYCEAAGLELEPARRWARLRALAEAGALTERQSEWRGELERVAAALGALS